MRTIKGKEGVVSLIHHPSVHTFIHSVSQQYWALLRATLCAWLWGLSVNILSSEAVALWSVLWFWTIYSDSRLCKDRKGTGGRELLEVNAVVQARETEGSVVVPQKFRNRMTGYIPKIIASRVSRRHLHTHVHSHIIQNSQKVEVTQESIHG